METWRRRATTILFMESQQLPMRLAQRLVPDSAPREARKVADRRGSLLDKRRRRPESLRWLLKRILFFLRCVLTGEGKVS